LAFVTTGFFADRGGFRRGASHLPGIRTEPEIYLRLRRRFAQWPANTSPRAAIMSAQKREAKKNFIALLSEITEEQQIIERPAKSDRPVRRGLFGLLTAALNRNNS
jgi:hypothetical protein